MITTIKTKSLKDILRLFDEDLCVNGLILGDTMHLSAGYVDETLIDGIEMIRDILEFDYDFLGLVEFEATVSDIVIKLIRCEDEADNHFQLQGSEKSIRLLRNRVIELNAKSQGRYIVGNS